MTRVAAAGTALVVAALTACGVTDGASGARPPTTADPAVRACERVVGPAAWHGTVRVRGRSVAFDARDDYFVPTCLVVPRDRRVTLVVTNRGHLPHTVTLPGVGLDQSVDAGETVFVTLPATTRPLRLVCSYHVAEHMFAAVVPATGS